MEIAKGGRVIGSVGEWFSIAPPKRGREHWVDGRSAKELAKAWFPFSGTASVPREIKILLNSSNVLGAIKLIDAEPESIVRFDAFRGEPRNCDLLARGQSDLGTVVVSIEGKADEPFGKLIGEEFDAGVARSGSKLPDRMRLLTMGILGRTVEQSRELRYQLLHGIAGSITAAKSRGARIAIFLVHEFLTPLTDPIRIRSNENDLDQFVTALTNGETGSVAPGHLYGPRRVPGNPFIPSDIDLFLGRTVRDTR